jgi:hypothetical protein
MDDEDQEDVNPLMGGVEDVDNNMIDTKFILQKCFESPLSGNRCLNFESLHEFGQLCHPDQN